MTIAAVWFSERILWCAADTRISREGLGGGIMRLTDAGAKIYPLRLLCRKSPEFDAAGNIVYPTPHVDTRLGLVFAGNTLVASQAVAMMSTTCQMLETFDVKDIPTLNDVAQHLSRTLSVYILDLREGLNDTSPRSKVSFIVFGVCPKTRRYEAWIVSDRFEDGQVKMSVDWADIYSQPYVITGSGCDRFIELYESYVQQGIDPSRLPRRVIGEMAREGRADVGGSLSLGWVRPDGFSIAWTTEPLNVGEPKSRRTLNGIDLDELGPVGPAMIAGLGMA